jgi:Domain of unknown function (DUF1707)
MDRDARDFPPGGLRVSDVERDQALSELTDAFQAGRIARDEFDDRSTQVLTARTGQELTAVLADLPLARADAKRTLMKPAHRVIAVRTTMGAAAVAAVSLAAVSITTALSYAPKTLAEREFEQKVAEKVLSQRGISVPVPLPVNPGFDWGGTITPAIFAVLLIGLIIALHKSRADRL